MTDKKVELERTAKGRRPQYFDDPAVDKLHAMVLALVEELSVTRDRADTLERILEAAGIISIEQIDNFRADEETAIIRNKQRTTYIKRIMKTFSDEIAALERTDESLEYEEVIKIVDQ